jgi:hypothetical protein
MRWRGKLTTAMRAQDAWHQPIIRLLDAVVGITVGVACKWMASFLYFRYIGTPAQGGRRGTPEQQDMARREQTTGTDRIALRRSPGAAFPCGCPYQWPA